MKLVESFLLEVLALVEIQVILEIVVYVEVRLVLCCASSLESLH